MVDAGTLLVALIAAAPSTVVAIRGWRNPSKLDSIHLDINSRISELVGASKAASKAEGIELGRVNERDRRT